MKWVHVIVHDSIHFEGSHLPNPVLSDTNDGSCILISLLSLREPLPRARRTKVESTGHRSLVEEHSKS